MPFRRSRSHRLFATEGIGSISGPLLPPVRCQPDSHSEVSTTTTTAAPAVPGDVVGIVVTPVGDTGLEVVWDILANVDSYIVRAKVFGQSDDLYVEFPTVSTSLTLTPLIPNTQYAIQVAGVNGVGTGSFGTDPLLQYTDDLWIPSELGSQLFDWFSADNVAQSGDVITEVLGLVNSISLIPVSAQPSLETAVINGKDAVLINPIGSGAIQTPGNYATDSAIMLISCKIGSAQGNTARIFDWTAYNTGMWLGVGASQELRVGGARWVSGSPYGSVLSGINNTWQTLGLHRDKDSQEDGIWIEGDWANRARHLTSDQVAIASGKITVAGDGGGGSGVNNMRFRHVVLCNSQIQDADRQKIEGFIAHDEGRESSLPSDHPYFTNPPYKLVSVPLAPLDVAVDTEATTDTTVTLTWTPFDASQGGDRIITYRAQRELTPTPWDWYDVDLNAPNVSGVMVCGNLLPNTTYYFRMQGWNDIGLGYWSDPISATTLSGPPSPPQNINVGAVSPTSVTITWDASASDGGSAILRYVCEYADQDDPDTWITFSQPDNTTGTVEITGLAKNHGLTVRLFAESALGRSLASDGQFTSTLSSVPGAPTNLLFLGSTSTTLNFSWTAPDDNGGSDIADYLVQYKKTGDSDWIAFFHDPSIDTETTITDLVDDPSLVSYDMRVAAVNISDGPGDFSTPTSS